jgi:hypothetical protein
MSSSATLIRLYEFLKNNSHLSMTNQNAPTIVKLSPNSQDPLVCTEQLDKRFEAHHPFQLPGSPGAALTQSILVEDDGIEPTTPCLQSRCSPS